MAWRFHAIDATLSPWPRRLDGVEAHEGPRNISQDNLTHWLISTGRRLHHKAHARGRRETDHQGRPAGAARARRDPRQLGRVAREPPETGGRAGRRREIRGHVVWYAGDFESRGGSPTYAARYAPAGAARDALATMAPSYFAYDWNLNTQ